jgi:hypothetical protein
VEFPLVRVQGDQGRGAGRGASTCSPARARLLTLVPAQVFAYVGEWNVEEPKVYPGISGDRGLVIKSKAAHHAISVPFSTPLDPAGKTLVVQYEVKLQKVRSPGPIAFEDANESDSCRDLTVEELTSSC